MLKLIVALALAQSAASSVKPTSLDDIMVDVKESAKQEATRPTEVQKVPVRREVGSVLFSGLEKFHGKPQQYAFDTLGYPDRKMLIGSDTIYSWVNTEPDNLSCTVKVIVRAKRILKTDFSGNNGACALYAREVDPTFHGSY